MLFLTLGVGESQVDPANIVVFNQIERALRHVVSPSGLLTVGCPTVMVRWRANAPCHLVGRQVRAITVPKNGAPIKRQ